MPNANERRLKSENDDLKRTLAAMRVSHAEGHSVLARMTKERGGLMVDAAKAVGLDDFRDVLDRGVARIEASFAAAEQAAKLVAQKDDAVAEALESALAAKALAEKAIADRLSMLTAHEDAMHDVAKERTRRTQAEDREAHLLARLTKRLPVGWQGMAVKTLGATPQGAAALHALLVDVLGWMTEQDLRKRTPSAPPAKKYPSGAAKRKAAAAKINRPSEAAMEDNARGDDR